MLWHISNWLLFKMVTFPPAGSRRGFSFNLHCEDLLELLELKLTKLLGGLCMLGPLQFLLFRLIHTQAPTILQLKLRFSYFRTDSQGDFCSSKLLFSASARLVSNFRNSGMTSLL